MAGRPIIAEVTTFTVAVVSGSSGGALAWIMATPVPTLVTGTVTLLTKAGTVTCAGTLATVMSVELRATVKPPAGAGAARFRTRFAIVPLPPIVRLCGEKPTAVPTNTDSLSPVKPDADALSVAVPKSTPVIRTGTGDVVVPPGTMRELGDTVSFDVSLLESTTNAPPGPARFANTSGNWSVWPGRSESPEGKMISGVEVTTTVTVALDILGAAPLAVMVAVPAARPVTGTLTPLEAAAKVTVAGAVTNPELLETKLTTSTHRPPAGQVRNVLGLGPDNVKLFGEKLNAAPICTFDSPDYGPGRWQ